MPASIELAGTHQDINLWVDSDTLLSGTVTDADGAVVDLTDCDLKWLIKRSLADADVDAIASATMTIVSAVAGTWTADIDRNALDPETAYAYSFKIKFPATYAITRWRGKQFQALYGTHPTQQDATRDATS